MGDCNSGPAGGNAASRLWRELQSGCRAADGTAKPQGLASMAWAFATMDHPDEKLFTALARAAERRVSDFIAQNIANIAWASATLNELDEKLLTA